MRTCMFSYSVGLRGGSNCLVNIEDTLEGIEAMSYRDREEFCFLFLREQLRLTAMSESQKDAWRRNYKR